MISVLIISSGEEETYGHHKPPDCSRSSHQCGNLVVLSCVSALFHWCERLSTRKVRLSHLSIWNVSSGLKCKEVMFKGWCLILECVCVYLRDSLSYTTW